MCVHIHIYTLYIHYMHIYAHTYILYNHKHLLVVKGLFFNKIGSISGFYFCSAILQEVNISTFNIKETIYIWKRAIGFLMKKLEKCIILQHYSKWFFFFFLCKDIVKYIQGCLVHSLQKKDAIPCINYILYRGSLSTWTCKHLCDTVFILYISCNTSYFHLTVVAF